MTIPEDDLSEQNPAEQNPAEQNPAEQRPTDPNAPERHQSPSGLSELDGRVNQEPSERDCAPSRIPEPGTATGAAPCSPSEVRETGGGEEVVSATMVHSFDAPSGTDATGKYDDAMPAIPCCHNCHAVKPPEDRFCRHCGQKHTNLNETVFHFLGDFLTQALSIDGRIFGTLRRLLFHPGQLTNEFMLGRRKRYLSPVQTYLLSMFLLFYALGQWVPMERDGLVQFHLGDKPNLAGQRTPPADNAATESDQAVTEHAPSVPGVAENTAENMASSNDNDKATVSPDRSTDRDDETPFLIDNEEFRQLSQMDSQQAAEFLAERGLKQWYVAASLWRISRLSTQLGAERYYTTLLTIASQVALIMLPLLAVLLRILFLRRSRSLLQTFVLSSNLHVVTSLVVSLLMLIGLSVPNLILISLVVAGTHSAIALRRVFGESWFWTLFKMGLATFVYWIVMGVGLAVISTVSLFLYE